MWFVIRPGWDGRCQILSENPSLAATKTFNSSFGSRKICINVAEFQLVEPLAALIDAQLEMWQPFMQYCVYHIDLANKQ